MAARGRVRYEQYVSDDDESYYDEVGYPAPSHRRDSSRLRVKVVEDRLRSPGRRQKVLHTQSYGTPEVVLTADSVHHLNVPQQRPRASSTGAPPQPIFINVPQPPAREASRERRKHYHYDRYEYSESESDHGSSQRKHRRRKSSPHNVLDADTIRRLAKLEIMEETGKHKYRDQETEVRLARLKRDEEEAAILARIEERKRREKQQEQAFLLEYKEKQRQEEEAEKAAIAQAEAKRVKREAEQKAERDRIILLEKEKTAKEKAERLRIMAEIKDKEDREKREAEEERKRILLEEELRKRKEKDDHEELRRRILAEEEERIAKDKAKKKKEEEEFQAKVKERFMRAGYSPDYIEDILEEKKKGALARRNSRRTRETDLVIDMARPTYIRVRLEHLYPETLDAYDLPWDFDPTDERYVLIKEYISHSLQQELFEHTRKLKIRREKLLITDGYVKDTVTTLKPKNVFKDKNTDEMFMVRRKSVSKSPARRSWMFT